MGFYIHRRNWDFTYIAGAKLHLCIIRVIMGVQSEKVGIGKTFRPVCTGLHQLLTNCGVEASVDLNN